MPGPPSLVYGIVNDSLVLLPEGVAIDVATDLEAIWRLRTYGEARRFWPRHLEVPGLDDDDDDEVPADEDPYDVAQTNQYQNGDWPPPAATVALDLLPDDLDDIGEERDSFPGFPTLFINPARETDLVETLIRRGYEVRRDDALIERMGA